MEELIKLHDKCLEYEISIDMAVEKLEDMRIKAFKSGDTESFKKIMPVLDAVIEIAKEYRGFLYEKSYLNKE